MSRSVRVSSAPATAHPGDPIVTVGAAGAGAPDAGQGSDADTGTAQSDVGRGNRGADAPTRVTSVSAADPQGRATVEVLADGWRFEFLVEDTARAALRERATRAGSASAGSGGPLEIRAIIPGRVAAVVVAPGDEVELGQTLLVVEAMKMQNELRAPRAGIVGRVPAAPGATIELGDVLVVLE